MNVELPNNKVITPTNHNRSKRRDEPIRIPRNFIKAREKSRVQGAIGFGFSSYWLKKWREILQPITKHSNRNRVFLFDSHLKIALKERKWFNTEDSTTCVKVVFLFKILLRFFFMTFRFILMVFNTTNKHLMERTLQHS